MTRKRGGKRGMVKRAQARAMRARDAQWVVALEEYMDTALSSAVLCGPRMQTLWDEALAGLKKSAPSEVSTVGAHPASREGTGSVAPAVPETGRSTKSMSVLKRGAVTRGRPMPVEPPAQNGCACGMPRAGDDVEHAELGCYARPQTQPRSCRSYEGCGGTGAVNDLSGDGSGAQCYCGCAAGAALKAKDEQSKTLTVAENRIIRDELVRAGVLSAQPTPTACDAEKGCRGPCRRNSTTHPGAHAKNSACIGWVCDGTGPAHRGGR